MCGRFNQYSNLADISNYFRVESSDVDQRAWPAVRTRWNLGIVEQG